MPQGWVGHSLRELELPRRFRISVLAVHGILMDQMVAVPNPDAPLKDSDTLLVADKDEDLAHAARQK